MTEHKAFQETLFQEIKGRIPQTDEAVPYLDRDGWHYSWRIKDGEQYATYFRTRGGEEQTILNLNEIGKDHEFVSIGTFDIPKDTYLLWYTLDLTGFRQYKLRARDLRREIELDFKDLDKFDIFERVVDFAVVEGRDDAMWLVIEDEETKRADSLYFWRLHEDGPKLIYHEEDERFSIGIKHSSDTEYLIITISSLTSTEVWVDGASSLKPNLRLLIERQQDIELSVDHYEHQWFIHTNETGRNFSLKTVDDQRIDGRFQDLIPHREDVLLEGYDIFEKHFVAAERHEGVTKLFVYDMSDGKISNRREIKFPEEMVEAEFGDNCIHETPIVRVAYESMTTSEVVYDCDMRTMELKELKRKDVLGGYNPDDYTSYRIYATAPDGTKIPITLAHRKDTPLDGTAPMYMVGYGAYGLSYELYFSYGILSLINRGFIYAITHVRGGMELGKPWHDQGRMENKMNSFTDFIACAEHVVDNKLTSSDRLCAQGASAGGLLMGGITNMRPDLFKVVYNRVPFVDVLTTMLDEDMPLVVGEYEEWGNPNDKEQYFRMKEYSPYDNIEAKDYPALLVRTAYNDSQVMYWEPAKYVAKLRATKTDDNPLLFVCPMVAGHGGSSGRFDRYRDLAFDFAFICSQVGITA